MKIISRTHDANIDVPIYTESVSLL